MVGGEGLLTQGPLEVSGMGMWKCCEHCEMCLLLEGWNWKVSSPFKVKVKMQNNSLWGFPISRVVQPGFFLFACLVAEPTAGVYYPWASQAWVKVCNLLAFEGTCIPPPLNLCLGFWLCGSAFCGSGLSPSNTDFCFCAFPRHLSTGPRGGLEEGERVRGWHVFMGTRWKVKTKWLNLCN